MNAELLLTLLATLVTLTIGVGTWLNHRRANETTAAKVEAEIGHSVVEDYLLLDRRVSELVEQKLGPLREEVAQLRHREAQWSRILRRVWAQWPKEHPAPELEPDELQAIESTLPPGWLEERS
ncbi:hypothetical protein [Agromyces larvae]|uniref:Uncharacterized protein n=1 Tax=Agromyces larvae TaxID=2929802 RepID=A0ABY4C1W7_9MICO|nr:hypothetical protein [Agromyces larvae]UOE45462.1 hypothetical protein MTO99_06815 [Agromyces larvae]